jgi:AcrR family transcriptional regulator
MPKKTEGGDDASDARKRILNAAFEVFTERGYDATSTLDIAKRARVSKRELYSLVGNKRALLVAGITARSKRLQAPSDLPEPNDRESLAEALSSFGKQILREVTDSRVVAVFRLAIAEAVRAPEVARAVDSIGRDTVQSGLRHLMARAQTSGLIEGRPAELAEEFRALLWGNLMVNLLLGVTEQPGAREIAARAREATATFLQLHPSRSGSTKARLHGE